MSAPPARREGPLPALAFTGCCLIWSSTFLFISMGNDTVPPLWAATLRLVLAAAVLVPLSLARGGLPRGAATRPALQYGFFQFGLSFPLLYWSEVYVPSGVTAVVFAIIPLSAAVLAHAVGLERLRLLKVAGALVALGGVALIFAGQIHGTVPALPFLAALLAAVLASVGTVLLKRGPRQSPWGANAVGTVLGAPLCFGASLLAGERHALPTTFASFGPILYLALAGSLGAFILMSWLVHRWPVTRVSFIAVITPIVALALGAIVRHEPVTAGGLAGSVVVLAGVGLALWSDRRATSVATAPR